MIDNASPIDDEDLDSLDDFDQDVVAENNEKTIETNKSVIQEQVELGVAVRMACLKIFCE